MTTSTSGAMAPEGQGTWIVPFAGRHPSYAVRQNFLWRDGVLPVYIMDNHRAAMWCWLQETGAVDDVNLMHIDEHYDTLYANIDRWMSELPDLDGMSIESYLALETNTSVGKTPLIRWDTYLSLFLERYKSKLGRCIFATHGIGDKPRLDRAMHVEFHHLPNNAALWVASEGGRWIVNVDLDYFFCDMDGDRRAWVTMDYLRTLFGGLKSKLVGGQIVVLTICLTPDAEYTGGWAQAEAMCRTICEILDIQFALPPP